MNRLVRHTISGLRHTLDLQGRATPAEYGHLVLSTFVFLVPTAAMWALFGAWCWPLLLVNAWMLLACITAGVRRLRDAGQHVGWAMVHGSSMLLIVAAYGLLLADIDLPKPEVQPGVAGVIGFLLMVIITVTSLALLQMMMLAPIGIFVITTPVMIWMVLRPSAEPISTGEPVATDGIHTEG